MLKLLVLIFGVFFTNVIIGFYLRWAIHGTRRMFRRKILVQLSIQIRIFLLSLFHAEFISVAVGLIGMHGIMFSTGYMNDIDKHVVLLFCEMSLWANFVYIYKLFKSR